MHSPFVYDLITNCFYDKTRYEVYLKLLAYRKSLLHDHTAITITDFGSGSKVFKSNTRAISAIAKTSGTTQKRAELLLRIVQYFKPKHSLELGTSLGIATQALALGHSGNQITSIEGCPNSSAFTKKQLSEFDIKNVEIKTGAFEVILPQLKNNTYDLIFFDGNHTKTATVFYFSQLIDNAHNNAIFIFDDIYWSKDMQDAWEIIKAHPKVTVTIDTFFWGIVSFRKEQVKEHFKIRV